MKTHCWLRTFLLLGPTLWVFSASLASDSQGSVAYEVKANPTDKLTIVGTISKGIAIELAAFWQTTVVNDECAIKLPLGLYLPEHQYSPKKLILPVRLERRANDRATWITWRDLLSPGACGWQLSSIEYKVDTSQTALSARPDSSPWSRISSVCGRDCVPNSAQINDDASEPVHQYCKFSLLRNTAAQFNPCVFERDGKIWTGVGTPGKSQHILRSGQHYIQFVLTDLEASGANATATDVRR